MPDAPGTQSDEEVASPEHLDRLHKLWQQAVASLGADDEWAKQAHLRWQLASQKARAAKPITTQMWAVEKKIKQAEKKFETAHVRLDDAHAAHSAAKEALVGEQASVTHAKAGLDSLRQERAKLAQLLAPGEAAVEDIWEKLGFKKQQANTPRLQEAMRAFTEALNMLTSIQHEECARADPYEGGAEEVEEQDDCIDEDLAKALQKMQMEAQAMAQPLHSAGSGVPPVVVGDEDDEMGTNTAGQGTGASARSDGDGARDRDRSPSRGVPSP